MEKDFESIKKEYDKLSQDMAKADIARNPEKLKTVAKRLSQLEPLIKKIKELDRIKRQIAEARDTITEDTDSDLVLIAQEELKSLTELGANIENDLTESIKPKDPLDQKNIIIEIRAGTGGDEAALFAANLFRMYSRYAERSGWKTKILSSSQIGIGGFKEVILEISGTKVYKNLKYESGIHRVQRVPETEKSGRIHTSAATVAVLPEAEEVDIKIKPEDLRIDVFRAGGHGGQSVNTTDSAVRITHLPTNTVVTCQDEKSQQQNKAKAMQILRSRVLAAEQEKVAKERGDVRKSQIGSGERSEKIRTYNWPQDRVTDHRIKQSWNQLENLMDGKIQPIIDKLTEADK